jgi:hypothetical protein
VFDADWLHRPLGALLVTVLAAGVVSVLCTRPVRRAFRFATEPRMEWAFRQGTVRASGGRTAPEESASGREAVPAQAGTQAETQARSQSGYRAW